MSQKTHGFQVKYPKSLILSDFPAGPSLAALQDMSGFRFLFLFLTLTGTYANSLLGNPLQAKTEAETHQFIVCEKIEFTGLFEQCEVVRILKRSSQHVRSYSLPRKRVLNTPITQVFETRETHEQDQFQSHEKVLIPGRYLWSESKDGFQTLCRVQNQNQNILKVQCGDEVRQVRQNKVIKVLHDLSSEVQISEIPLHKTTQKSSR